MMTYEQQLNDLIKNALIEDIGDGDHSTLSTIDSRMTGKAVLKIKEDGVLAGVEIAKAVFHYLEPGAKFSVYKTDGEVMVKGETAFEVEARVHTILQCERLALNCMQRMSGIATLTRKFTNKLKDYHTKVLDTRKTTPNFRLLEKEAVHMGGGINHRMGLYDMIMLKDNHIDYCGGLEKAINKAFNYVQTKKPGLKIEVETRTIADVKKVVEIAEG
ncbi:MAG: carboxylating nicotinate-nucleotide diphosphorylase, partial [Sphingobacteriales bacterium]